jgi:predicted DNA-binding protein (MmcQ/YjbR family)
MDEAAVRRELIDFALGLPDAWEDHPWGESVAKVGKKVFLFAGGPAGGRLSISVKLTDSHEQALDFEGAAPTGYGLGRSGWVTVPVSSAPVPVLADFIEESYRLIAPKRAVAVLDASPPRSG